MEVLGAPKALHTDSLTLLIDDDVLIHLTWNLMAKRHGKGLQTFYGPSEFFQVAHTLGLNTPIYVDVQLANGVRGEDVAHQIAQLGFSQIYLATGFFPETIKDFQHLPFIQGVVGKSPPWS